MSRKNSVKKRLVAAQSLATAFTSPVTVIRDLDNVSYQINVTTTDSAGTFAVQVSNDYTQSEVTNTVEAAGTWSNLTLSGVPTLTGASDVINITLNQPPFNAIRLAYTPTTAGTGTCAIFIQAKQVGG